MAELESFCGGPFQTNGYLVSCGSQNVLFDAPMGITDWLTRNGKTIDLLILTHQHHDHIMDVAALVEAFDCPVWAFSDLDDELTLKSSLEAATGMEWDLGDFTVSRHLSESEPIEIEGRTFNVLHIPGHSPDSLCFHDATDNFVIGGDVLFKNSVGRTDFPNGSMEQLTSGIRAKLWPLPDDTVVYPGHGPCTEIGYEKRTNPYVG
ncbi:MAG: MBL fold metallo-hydrolase [Verrucomicrobiales bacterium]|nr:MBL fold metallo-hydrolase [Verrucomicrobiales bacterium]